MNELILKVDGMVCGGCENRVQNALKTIAGIEAVIADHKSGVVKITAKASVDKDTIKEKIEDIGFSVRED